MFDVLCDHDSFFYSYSYLYVWWHIMINMIMTYNTVISKLKHELI